MRTQSAPAAPKPTSGNIRGTQKLLPIGRSCRAGTLTSSATPRRREIRRAAGLDAARVVLGHRSPQITEVYAELDIGQAAEVMAKLG
jgi:hypothetical protein